MNIARLREQDVRVSWTPMGFKRVAGGLAQRNPRIGVSSKYVLTPYQGGIEGGCSYPSTHVNPSACVPLLYEQWVRPKLSRRA